MLLLHNKDQQQNNLSQVWQLSPGYRQKFQLKAKQFWKEARKGPNNIF